MTDYLLKFSGVTPVTNPDGSITLDLTPPALPPNRIAVVGIIAMSTNVSGASVPLPGAEVGDVVSYIAVLQGSTSVGGPTQNLSTFFETTISVAGHIQQLGPISPTTIHDDDTALVILTRVN